MKKTLTMIVLVVSCLCFCTACGGKDDGNGEKPDDKVTEAPSITEPADTPTPEPTATATPVPTKEVEATPTEAPVLPVDTYTATDFSGEWYLTGGVIDGAEYTAEENQTASKLIIGEDLKVVYDELLWGYDNRVNEVQCEFTPADSENASKLFGEFENEGLPESYTVYLCDDGTLVLDHYFTYDQGTVPVVSEQYFTRDSAIYDRVLETVVLDASFISYGAGSINKTIYDENSNSVMGRVSAPYILFDEKRYWVDSTVADTLNERFAGLAENNCARLENVIGLMSEEEKAELAEKDRSERFFLDMNFLGIRSDSAVFSGIVDTVGFLGGPHPDNSFAGINYDMTTGKEILLSDFCKDSDRLAEILIEKLQNQYPEVTFLDVENAVKGMMEENRLPFAIGYGGVDFYFAPMSVAPYADGTLAVEVAFDEYEGLFTSRYSGIPYSYAVKAAVGGIPYFMDLDSDGNREKVTLYGLVNDWGDYGRLMVYADDELILDYELDEYSYDMTTLLMQNDEGNYLFTGITFDSDDNMVLGFKADSEGKLVKTGSWLGAFDSFEGQVEDWNGEETWVLVRMVNEPYGIVLVERNDLLGTKSVLYYCSISADGVLETSSDMHRFLNFSPEWNKLTTLRKINAYSSNASGNKGEEITISKGTELLPYAVIGTTTVIFTNMDESEYYLVEFDGEGGTIGGKSNWELFDGLLFAD